MIVEGLITRGHSGRSACRITGLSRSTFHAHRRRPVSNQRVRRIIVADAIEKIHRRSRGTYGKRRIRAELLDTYEMNVNHKLVSAITTELGIAGLPRPGKRKPNLLGVETLSDRVNRGFTASRPNELCFTDITEHPPRDKKVLLCDFGLFQQDDRGSFLLHDCRYRTGHQCGEHGRAGTDPLGGNDLARRSWSAVQVVGVRR